MRCRGFMYSNGSLMWLCVFYSAAATTHLLRVKFSFCNCSIERCVFNANWSNTRTSAQYSPLSICSFVRRFFVSRNAFIYINVNLRELVHRSNACGWSLRSSAPVHCAHTMQLTARENSWIPFDILRVHGTHIKCSKQTPKQHWRREEY